MKTYRRICIKNFELSAENGDYLKLKKGKEYLTSPENEGEVTVFTNFWVEVPADLFAGEILFSP